MPEHQPFPPTEFRPRGGRVRVAALLAVLGLLATGLAIGPAWAGDDRSAQGVALRSTVLAEAAAQETGDETTEVDRNQPASVGTAGSASSDGDRLRVTLRDLDERPEAKTELKVGADKTGAEASTAPVEKTATGGAAGIIGGDGPMPLDDDVTIEEDSAPFFVDVLFNDAFVGLVDVVGTDATGGSVICDIFGCTFTLARDFNGPASFRYFLVDESGLEGDAMVFIDVLPVNDGPQAPDRFFTTTYGADPLVIDGLDGVTDPEGDPIFLDDAFIVEGVGTLDIDGTHLIYTPPTDPVINPFAGIDVFYGDALGAFGIGTIFIDIVPDTEPVCEVVELFSDELLVNRAGQDSAFVIPDRMLGCDYYDLELTSTDGRHEPGYQPEQTGEAWFVEGIGLFADLAEVVYTSPVTDDLPEDQSAAVTRFGPIDPYALGIEGWQIRHAGEGGVNSVGATLRLIPSPPPLYPGCDPIVVFENSRLLNRAGDHEATVPFIAPTCKLPYATIALVSTDPGHAQGFQPEQDEEIWSLEALDVDGNVLFTVAGPDDLPDDIDGEFVYVELPTEDLHQVASFRIRHDATGPGINSVDASVYVFFELI